MKLYYNVCNVDDPNFQRLFEKQKDAEKFCKILNDNHDEWTYGISKEKCYIVEPMFYWTTEDLNQYINQSSVSLSD